MYLFLIMLLIIFTLAAILAYYGMRMVENDPQHQQMSTVAFFIASAGAVVSLFLMLIIL